MKYSLFKDINLFAMEVVHILLYKLAVRIPLDNKIWIFGSWFGISYNDNSKYLFEYVSQKLPGITAVWLSRKKNITLHIRGRGFKAYHFYSPRGIWYALRAGIAIFSVGYSADIPGFCISPSKKLIQLWHGAFLKNFGVLDQKPKDTNQRAFPHIQNLSLTKIILFLYNYLFQTQIKNISHMAYKLELYQSYTHIFSLSPIIKKEYVDSFGIPKDQTDKVVITGFARDDILVNNKSTYKNRVFGIIRGIHKSGGSVGFYLPTHRQEGQEEILKTIVENLKTSIKMLEENKIFILVKLHQFHQFESSSENLKNVIFITDQEIDGDVYPYLSMTDFMVTDYSGIYFDYLLVDKPIIFLIYDFDQYTNIDRDFYFPYEKITAGPKVLLWNQLVPTINKELKKDTYKKMRQKMRRKFHIYFDGNSTKRAAERIYNTFIQ